MQRPSFLHTDKYEAHAVLASVSRRYSPLPGRLSTCYSPVRHFTCGRSRFHVRLACVKHAASVQSEPESNSPVKKLIHGEISFSLRTQSSLPNSLFSCQRTSLRNLVPQRRSALCTFAPLMSTKNLEFFLRSSRAQARKVKFSLYPTLVNYFFALFSLFSILL